MNSITAPSKSACANAFHKAGRRAGDVLGGSYRVPDTRGVGAAIRTDLERGANSIWLRVDPDAISAADIADDLAQNGDALLLGERLDNVLATMRNTRSPAAWPYVSLNRLK